MRTIYLVKPDREATSLDMLRVVDESGEDYLYPAECFVPIRLSDKARAAFVAVA